MTRSAVHSSVVRRILLGEQTVPLLPCTQCVCMETTLNGDKGGNEVNVQEVGEVGFCSEPGTLYHRDHALLYITYVILIWAAPIPG